MTLINRQTTPRMYNISPFYRRGIKAERSLVCCLRIVKGATSDLVNLEFTKFRIAGPSGSWKGENTTKYIRWDRLGSNRTNLNFILWVFFTYIQCILIISNPYSHPTPPRHPLCVPPNFMSSFYNPLNSIKVVRVCIDVRSLTVPWITYEEPFSKENWLFPTTADFNC